MKLIKDVDDNNLKPAAYDVMNRLKAGDRVFGKPAEGLKQTQMTIEKKLEDMDKNQDALDYIDHSGELNQDLAMIKAGINGEEELGNFIEKIIKNDRELQDCISFASLSDPDQDSGNGDYISDSDFLLVYGNDVLIVDAKNIRTSPDIPIYMQGNILVSAAGKEIIEIHPSVFIWKKIFEKYKLPYNSVHGCTVIVNKTGALVWRNPTWWSGEERPMHISEFVEYLHDWIKDKEPKTSLKLLAGISKMQIKPDKSDIADFTNAKRMFGI